MRCCVPFCKTTAEIVSESEEVAFHEFPDEAPLRAAWLRALGKQDTLLPDPAVVCSQHFLNDDIYETESGSWRIRTGAIPSTVQVCMICFDTHSKLFPMSKYKLEEAYEFLVGHPVCAQGNLRRAVCVQCAQRLVNFSKFRDKSLRAHALMMELVAKHELITIRHVKSISRAKHQLESGIVKAVLEPGHCNVHIEHCDEGRPTVAANSADEHLLAHNQDYFPDDSIASESRLLDDTLTELMQSKSALCTMMVKSEHGEPAQELMQCESVLCTMAVKSEHGESAHELMQCESALCTMAVKSEHGEPAHELMQCESALCTMAVKSEHSEPAQELMQCESALCTMAVKSEHGEPAQELLQCESALCTMVVKSEHGEPAQELMQCESAPCSAALCCEEHYDGRIHEPKSSEDCDRALVAPSGVATNHESKEHPTDTNDETDILCFAPNRIVVEDARNPQARSESKSHTNSHLVKRTRTHTGEKPFACKLCNYKCTKYTNLVRHMRTHTGEKPFACKLCVYKFTSNSDLVRHMRTHTGEKPFACKLCKYKCTQNSNLAKHMRTHTGEKPFVCKLCECKFTQNSNLAKHMRTHTGEKPFVCKLCECKFTQNSNLVQHMMRTHTGQKLFTCKLCKYKFTKNSYLVKHMMRTHSEIMQVQIYY